MTSGFRLENRLKTGHPLYPLYRSDVIVGKFLKYVLDYFDLTISKSYHPKVHHYFEIVYHVSELYLLRFLLF